MQSLAPPIPFSADDLERRRLENTIDHDLSSLSFTASTSFTSGSSMSTIPVARSAHVPRALSPDYPRFPGMDEDTPRAAKRAAASFARTNDFSQGVGASPSSTAGHHISAATLGAGVFKRPATSFRDRTGEEFDPDRSLGRLVSELNKAKDEERFPPKPPSPFSADRSHSPHSPSPVSSTLPNLSFQLTRNQPPLSPPHSRTVSASSSGSQRQPGSRQESVTPPNGRMSIGGHSRQGDRTVLGDTARHNRPPPPTVPGSGSMRDKGRFKGPTLVPVVINPNHKGANYNVTSADITGLTGLLATPAKGDTFEDLNKNGTDVGSAGGNIPQALSTLHARIRALETENGVSRRRIRELEAEVERARDEVVSATRQHDGRLHEVMGEKAALEELVASLRENLKRLTIELEEHKAMVSHLRMAAQQPPSPVRPNDSVRDELADLRKEVERLSREVAKLNHIAEAGLAERTRAREQRSVRINALDLHNQDEVDRVRADVERRTADFSAEGDGLPSQLRQGLHATAAAEPKLMPPSAAIPTRVADSNISHRSQMPPSPSPPTRNRTLHNVTLASPAHSIQSLQSQRSTSSTSSGRRRRKERKEGPDSPFPSIRVEDEEEFFSPTRGHAERPAERPAERHAERPASRNRADVSHDHAGDKTHVSANETVRAILVDGNVPPQTVLARVIRELEDDFGHYKHLYCELADQYKVLDAASVAAKRHVLAEHLKEVIDTLEHKADHIAALYSLLQYKDRPVSPTERTTQSRKSVRDLWRAVRESLPDDARRRLEADGLFRC